MTELRRKLLIIACTIFLCTAVFSGTPARNASPSVDSAYQQSWNQWKSKLEESRRNNWLPLAGLFWLKPGSNRFGSDPKNDVVFPKGPAHAGEFDLQGQDVTVKIAPGVSASVVGKPVRESKLAPDTAEDTTVVEMGSLRFHVIIRGQRVGIRLKDLESDAVRHYAGAQFFPLDLKYRVTAKWVPAEGNKTVDVPTVLGDTEPTPVAGTAVFSLNGQELRLSSLGGDPKESLFFVFSDPTSKSDTYPGGRFLDSDPVVNGTVVLDFNRSRNPPCAVTPYATCPLAPKENRLTVAIPAGEKYDRKHGRH